MISSTAMSGQQLLETLRLIGCPGADQLDTSSLEWLFDNEAMLPFLHWLCTSLSTENILTTEELKK